MAPRNVSRILRTVLNGDSSLRSTCDAASYAGMVDALFFSSFTQTRIDVILVYRARSGDSFGESTAVPWERLECDG